MLFSIILNSFIAVGVQKVAFKLYKQVCFYRRWSNNKTQFVAFWSREKKKKKGEKKKKKSMETWCLTSTETAQKSSQQMYSGY